MSKLQLRHFNSGSVQPQPLLEIVAVVFTDDVVAAAGSNSGVNPNNLDKTESFWFHSKKKNKQWVHWFYSAPKRLLPFYHSQSGHDVED